MAPVVSSPGVTIASIWLCRAVSIRCGLTTVCDNSRIEGPGSPLTYTTTSTASTGQRNLLTNARGGQLLRTAVNGFADRLDRPVSRIIDSEQIGNLVVIGKTEDGGRLLSIPTDEWPVATLRSVAAIIIVIVACPTSYWSVTRQRSSGGSGITKAITAPAPAIWAAPCQTVESSAAEPYRIPGFIAFLLGTIEPVGVVASARPLRRKSEGRFRLITRIALGCNI